MTAKLERTQTSLEVEITSYKTTIDLVTDAARMPRDGLLRTTKAQVHKMLDDTNSHTGSYYITEYLSSAATCRTWDQFYKYIKMAKDLLLHLIECREIDITKLTPSYWADIESGNEIALGRDTVDLSTLKVFPMAEDRVDLDALKDTTRDMELLSDTEAKKHGIIQGFNALRRAVKVSADDLFANVDQVAWEEILRIEKVEYDHLQDQLLRLEGIRDVKSMFQLERKRCADRKIKKVKAEGIDTLKTEGERKSTHAGSNVMDRMVLHAPAVGYLGDKKLQAPYRWILTLRNDIRELAPQQSFKGVYNQYSGLPGWELSSLNNLTDSIAIDAGARWYVSGLREAIKEALHLAENRVWLPYFLEFWSDDKAITYTRFGHYPGLEQIKVIMHKLACEHGTLDRDNICVMYKRGKLECTFNVPEQSERNWWKVNMEDFTTKEVAND